MGAYNFLMARMYDEQLHKEKGWVIAGLMYGNCRCNYNLTSNETTRPEKCMCFKGYAWNTVENDKAVVLITQGNGGFKDRVYLTISTNDGRRITRVIRDSEGMIFGDQFQFKNFENSNQWSNLTFPKANRFHDVPRDLGFTSYSMGQEWNVKGFRYPDSRDRILQEYYGFDSWSERYDMKFYHFQVWNETPKADFVWEIYPNPTHDWHKHIIKFYPDGTMYVEGRWSNQHLYQSTKANIGVLQHDD